jgi:riboflavin kinase / FMN adenylyltransferase
MDVSVMESVSWRGIRVSSTVVREALERGDLEQAKGLLGRPFSMSGRVVHGEKLGRALGFPTANVQLKRRKAPLAGIFAVRLHGVGKDGLRGVASLGTRPTVSDDGKATLEVHLFDFDGQIYGLHVSVEFLHKLRDEQRYADLETLARQIQADAENARAYFSSIAQAD